LIIEEIIVVEGRDDTVAINRAVQADTIETNGSAINEETINKIKLAQQLRGVIVLTDPDFPGEKIRNIISEKVPGVKHAFINRGEAKNKRGKIGVEYASVDTIRNALNFAHEQKYIFDNDITINDLIDCGLVGVSESKAKREALGMELKIGYANGKQLLKRLNIFHISREALYSAISQLDQEV
jgi:ribonuclease M5